MMRRLKKDVITELPDKQRQKITIETNKSMTKEISTLLNDGKIENASGMENIMMKMFGFENGNILDNES